MKKILVTGASGFIGSYLVSKLSEDLNCKIYAIDRKQLKVKKKNIFFIKKDLKFIKKYPKVDIVFHLAAYNGTKHFYKNPSDVINDNIIPTLNLIDFYSNQILVNGIGTVNYSTGTVSFNSLNPAGYIENSSDIRIYAKAEELDITSTNDMILVIDDTTTNTDVKRISGLTVTILTE